MGGRALQKYGIKTRRIEKTEYLDILSFVKEVFPAGREILYYREKSTFGDLDYFVSYSSKNREKIEENFKPTKIHSNTGVYSFDYKNFQIDIIQKPEEQLDIACNYFSYNDLGNLQGRAYHKMGLKYGSQGLIFPIRQRLFADCEEGSDHIIKELVLSLNPREIFEFMDYDYDRFLEGFNTLEDIFKYTCSTKYFSAENFQFENLNHTNRTRNRKRPTFCAFVEWINCHPEYDKGFNFGRKRDWIPHIHKSFPILEEIEAAREKWEKGRMLNAKFNGNLVIAWVGVQGKELGEILSKYRNEYRDLIEGESAETIKGHFLSWYSNLTK